MAVDKETRKAVRAAMKRDRAQKRGARKTGRAKGVEAKAEKAEDKGRPVRAARLRARADKKKVGAASELHGKTFKRGLRVKAKAEAKAKKKSKRALRRSFK